MFGQRHHAPLLRRRCPHSPPAQREPSLGREFGALWQAAAPAGSPPVAVLGTSRVSVTLAYRDNKVKDISQTWRGRFDGPRCIIAFLGYIVEDIDEQK